MNTEQKKTVYIAHGIDFSQAFGDPDGTFYCGTQQEEKDNTAKIASAVDLFIYYVDLHPDSAPEHSINGGLYPFHHPVKPERFSPTFVYHKDVQGIEYTLGNKTPSPRMTSTVEQALQSRKTGIFASRGVYFQAGGKKPWFTPQEIEETFGHTIITAEEFLKENYSYIIAPKQYFDATRTDSDFTLPKEQFSRIPESNYGIADLLRIKYPEEQYNLVFVNTGLVEGICRLHTSIGIRQMFPQARIINMADATTALYGIGLGFETAQQSREACQRIGKDIGIEYKTTEQFLDEINNNGG